jgi:hypothetical protein
MVVRQLDCVGICPLSATRLMTITFSHPFLWGNKTTLAVSFASGVTHAYKNK